MISYYQPVPGCDENGNEVTCTQIVGVSKPDAIKMQRHYMKVMSRRLGKDPKQLTEDELLDEYKVLHWATEDV